MRKLSQETLKQLNEIIDYYQSINLNPNPSPEATDQFINKLVEAAKIYHDRPPWSCGKTLVHSAVASIDHLMPEDDSKLKCTQKQFDTLVEKIGQFMATDFISDVENLKRQKLNPITRETTT